MQINLKTNGFNIGDKVIGKKTGTATPSTIVGMVFAQLTPYPNRPCERWDAEYPDWQDKMIAYTVFDIPVRPLSFEEFMVQRDINRIETPLLTAIGEDEKLLRAYYETTVKPEVSVAYPIDDLQRY